MTLKKNDTKFNGLKLILLQLFSVQFAPAQRWPARGDAPPHGRPKVPPSVGQENEKS